MNKMKLLTFAVIALLVLNIVLLGMMVVHGPPDHLPMSPPIPEEGPKRFIIGKLHFDSHQSKQYQILIDQHQSALKDLESAIQTTKHDLYLTLSDSTSLRKDSLIFQMSDLHRKIEILHYEHFEQIRHLCRAEQLPAFDQLSNELARLFQLKKNRPRPKD